MAEGVFRHLTNNLPSSTQTPSPLIDKIDSCGTGAYHEGDKPDPRTLSVLQDNGIKSYTHSARKFALQDFSDFDYILAMDLENLEYLQRLKRRVSTSHTKQTGSDPSRQCLAKVMLFGDFGGEDGEEVVDPYYGETDGFTVAYHQVKRFSEGLLAHIRKERMAKGVSESGGCRDR